ncbi:MAG: DUF3822 family protein [Dysgonamonadaceae bacterium]|jgi:hypothetical protein|nr:DUF3822 family protein [Dysgonamonadaceae bacterium]
MKINLPENIDLGHPEQYIFTIYIRPEWFSFSLYNPVEDGSYFYREIENGKYTDAFSHFKDLIFENDFFTFSFKKIQVMNHTAVFTYIPSLIFEEKHKQHFVKFLFSESLGKTLHHTLSTAGITILHQMPEEIYNFLLRTFVNPEIIHHSAPLIAYYQERSKRTNAKQMIVNRNKYGMDILCFASGTFLLGNHFQCNNLPDAVYYILFVWKQLKFNQLNDILLIAGDPVSKKELLEKTALYIHYILPVTIEPEAHFDQVDTSNIPFELATLSLCEL